MKSVFKSNKKYFTKATILFMAVAVLWLGTLGLFYHMSEMKMTGSISECLFDSPVGVCLMNFSEHLIAWQNIFSGLPQNTGLSSLIVLTILLSASLFLLINRFSLLENAFFRWKFLSKRHNQRYIFNSIKEAFSQGILNPKLFNIAK